MINKAISRQNIELYLGLISTALIPISKQWVIFSMGIWLLVSIFNIIADKREHLTIDIKKKTFIPLMILPLLYLLYIIGMSYSTNIEYGLFDLEVKLSMFLIPIIIILRSKIYSSQHRLFFLSLIAGCIVSFIVNTTSSFFLYLADGNKLDFFYSALSKSIHPSYMALYVSVCLMALAYYKTKLYKFSKRANIALTLFTVAILTTYLFMLSSKAGIISFAIAFSVYVFIRFAQRIKIIYALIIGLFFLIIPFIVITQIPSVSMRFKELSLFLKTDTKANIDSQYGSIVRMAIIKSTWQMSIDNLPWGVGTGDIKDEITKFYISRGSKTISSHYLNAHNQYAQTTITLGIPGLIVLLSFIILGLKNAYSNRKIIFLTFLIMLVIHFLFESMLEQQAGVIFITLFYTFFCIWEKPKLNNQE